MFVTDPIGDFIIRLKNASAVRKDSVVVPYSKFKHAIADVLKRSGFIEDFEKEGSGTKKRLVIKLAYKEDGRPKIQEAKRISKPGRRIYRSLKEIYPVKQGFGVLILSTPKGVLSDKEAKKEKVGGEALFEMF